MILALELILLAHAFTIEADTLVIELTSILLVISLIEIILVSREIHEHYQKDSFEREMTIRLDDFILERQMHNVSTIVKEFLDENPQYSKYRNSIYHISCQIMETHKRELWEKTLRTRLNRFVQKTNKKTIREIIDAFMKQFPEYKKNPERVYEMTACIIDKNK